MASSVVSTPVGCRANAPRNEKSISRHVLVEDFYRLVQRDRDELRYATFGHGDAKQAIHPRHRDGIVRDDDEARFGRRGHFVQQVAEALDIVVVERCVDLVQHADRRWIGEEHRENQGESRQRLLAAR